METWAQQDESWVESGCAALGSAAPWCSEHLAGRCFLLLFGFLEAKSQFLPAVSDSRWGSGPAGGWRVQQIHHQGRQWDRLRWERRREVGWCWFLFLQPLTAPALNHQAQKTWAAPKGASPQACAACPGLCTAGIKGNSIWRWEKQPWQPFFVRGWQREQSQGQISIWLICCWDGDTLESH